MFHITEFEIEGFWGRYKAAASLHPDVNIFIGRNGSGKTTLINILQAVLTVDLRLLLGLEFSSVIIKLREGRKRRTIQVTKSDDPELAFERVSFQVGTKKFEIPLYSREIDAERYLLRRPHARYQFQQLRAEIDALVNISTISVHREGRRLMPEDDARQSRHTGPLIDLRLNELLNELTQYQLSLADKANRVSSAFQGDVLASILYNDEFDNFSTEDIRAVKVKTLRADLLRVYADLGALNPEVEERIEKHIEAVARSVEALQRYNKDGTITVDDIMPLPLLRRTQHIAELSLRADGLKQEIFAPLVRFLEVVGGFIEGKTVSIGAKGRVIVEADHKELAATDLSSGEKQVLVFLTETLLQRGRFFIFIADEPELSLHIEWQAKIIGSLKTLNPDSQVIVATHSPEITAGWTDHVVDMDEVIHG